MFVIYVQLYFIKMRVSVSQGVCLCQAASTLAGHDYIHTYIQVSSTGLPACLPVCTWGLLIVNVVSLFCFVF